jgi:hypothetical protein
MVVRVRVFGGGDPGLWVMSAGKKAGAWPQAAQYEAAEAVASRRLGGMQHDALLR